MRISKLLYILILQDARSVWRVRPGMKFVWISIIRNIIKAFFSIFHRRSAADKKIIVVAACKNNAFVGRETLIAIDYRI